MNAIETEWAFMRARFEDMHSDSIDEKMDATTEYFRTASVKLDLFEFLANGKGA